MYTLTASLSSHRSLPKDTGVVDQFNETAIFIATPLKKHLAVYCTSEYFFRQFLDRKAVSSMPKYYLLADDLNQVSNFYPCVR